MPLARGVPERSTAAAAHAGRGERCFRGKEDFVCSLELGWPGEPLPVPVLAASRARRDTDLHPPSPSVPLSPPSCEPTRSGSWGLYKGRETSASSKESLEAGGVLPPSCLHVIQLPHARTSLAVSTRTEPALCSGTPQPLGTTVAPSLGKGDPPSSPFTEIEENAVGKPRPTKQP